MESADLESPYRQQSAGSVAKQRSEMSSGSTSIAEKKMGTVVVDKADKSFGVADGSKRGRMFLSAAISLWEELRSEAFGFILRGSLDTGTHQPAMDDVPHDEPSGGKSDSIGSNAGVTTLQRNVIANLENFGTTASEADTAQRLRKWCTVGSCSRSFDRALVRSLHRAGRGDGLSLEKSATRISPVAGAGWAAAAATSPSPSTPRVTLAVSDLPIDETLMFMYANSGFAKGSDLKVSDIVEAVKVRRRREASAFCGNRGNGRGSAADVSRKWRDSEPPGNAYASSECLPMNLSKRGAAVGMVERDHGREKIFKDKLEFKRIPPELQELMRRASFAKDARMEYVVRAAFLSQLVYTILLRISKSGASARFCLLDELARQLTAIAARYSLPRLVAAPTL